MLKTAGRGQEFVCQPNQNDKFEEWMLNLFSDAVTTVDQSPTSALWLFWFGSISKWSQRVWKCPKPYSPEFMCRKKWKKIEKTSLFFKVTPLVLINKSKKCRCFCSHQMTWVGLSQYSMNLMEVRFWISSELMQGCSSILEFCESKLHRYVSNHSERMSTKTKTVANIISKTGEK